MTDGTIFDKILARQIPAEIVYEDDDCLAFRDIHPQAPTHVLVIPKRRIVSLAATTDADAGLLGRILVAIRRIAEAEGLTGGFRIVANSGPDAGQSVDHLHFHLLGGRGLSWPPG